jgi:hypothetical protein
MIKALRINFTQQTPGVSSVLIHCTEGIIMDNTFKPFAIDVNISSTEQATLNDNPAWTDADVKAAILADTRYNTGDWTVVDRAGNPQ